MDSGFGIQHWFGDMAEVKDDRASSVQRHEKKMGGALDGLRVLDFSRVRAGPTCVRMLADFGADVIRVEPPADTDANAAMFADDRLGGDFQNLNRNKRSLALNLKQPQARDIVARLVRDADVVVENWRPAVKKKLGLDYEALSRINSRIILASISGYGQDGPYVTRPAFDQIIQGMGGLMSVTGLPGQGPVRAGIAVSDSSSGLYSAIGILLALRERARSGRGQWVHTSLLHTMIAMMDFQIARYLNDGELPEQEGNNHPTTCPMGLFSGADGMFNLGVAGEGMWQGFCAALQRPEWRHDPRFKTAELRSHNRDELNGLVQEILRTRSVAHWVEALNAAGVPAGPVYDVAQMLEDEQVRHARVHVSASVFGREERHFVTQPVILERTPACVQSAAPGLGEHSVQVLSELGYDEGEIAEFKAQKVI